MLMRRIVLAAVVFLTCGAATPAPTEPPGGGGGFAQSAQAMWFDMDGKTGVFYVAEAVRYAQPVPVTYGGVAKGRCTKTKTKRLVAIDCYAVGRMKEIPFEAFQMDPALRLASLAVHQGGRDHSVRWEATEPPGLGQEAAAGTWGGQAIAGAYAEARAHAEIFGADLGKGCSFCYLMESGGAGVYTDARTRVRWTEGVASSGGSLRIEIPRS
jgi:hypothetical protein